MTLTIDKKGLNKMLKREIIDIQTRLENREFYTSIETGAKHLISTVGTVKENYTTQRDKIKKSKELRIQLENIRINEEQQDRVVAIITNKNIVYSFLDYEDYECLDYEDTIAVDNMILNLEDYISPLLSKHYRKHFKEIKRLGIIELQVDYKEEINNHKIELDNTLIEIKKDIKINNT